MIRLFEKKFPALLLWPLSLVYGMFVVLRNVLYDIQIAKSFHINCPVLCIGNITVGGTGKTPMILYLAHFLKKQKIQIAVLSRGYGRKSKGTVLVCDGKQVLTDSSRGGDEPVLIAKQVMLPVVVDEDRVRGARYLEKHFSPDVILLDDGFQHRRLYRDINLLTLRPDLPFGNRFLLPAGPLRECIFQGMRRSDAILVNGKGTFKIKTAKPLFQSTYQGQYFIDSHSKYKPDAFSGKKAVAFCGIANPESFWNTLAALDIEPVHALSFQDHHSYSQLDLDRIQAFAADVDVVLTTEKDWVKLPQEIRNQKQWYALHVELKPCEEKLFQDFIKCRLKSVSLLYKKKLAF